MKDGNEMETISRALGLVERGEKSDSKIDRQQRIIPFVASTETVVDSHRSIILQGGLDWETRYKANPLFCWQHPFGELCNTPSHRRALGKGVKVERENGLTRVYVQFAKHEAAIETFEMYADGYLNACSIGIGRPFKVVNRDSEEGDIMALPDFARSALEAEECDFVVVRGTVLELSGCLAGSNTETLAERELADVVDTRMEVRERALCQRANRMAEELELKLLRMEEACARLERLALPAQERAVLDTMAQIERSPEIRALFGGKKALPGQESQ